MYEIGWSISASLDLQFFSKSQIQMMFDEVDRRLRDEPLRATRNLKRLRPNDLAELELRISRYRVFYDVDETEFRVTIVAVGVKRGARVLIRGEVYKL
jgi:mRNA-degrading endonuclease RelE of RelBE toxin-antitoxin system